AVFPQFVAVSCWNTGPAEYGDLLSLTIRIKPPGDDQDHILYDMQIEPAEAPRRRSYLAVYGFEFTHPGEWVFELLRGDTHCASHTLYGQQVSDAANESEPQVRIVRSPKKSKPPRGGRARAKD